MCGDNEALILRKMTCVAASEEKNSSVNQCDISNVKRNKISKKSLTTKEKQLMGDITSP